MWGILLKYVDYSVSFMLPWGVYVTWNFFFKCRSFSHLIKLLCVCCCLSILGRLHSFSSGLGVIKVALWMPQALKPWVAHKNVEPPSLMCEQAFMPRRGAHQTWIVVFSYLPTELIVCVYAMTIGNFCSVLLHEYCSLPPLYHGASFLYLLGVLS